MSQRPAATLVWMREEDDQLRGAAVSGESIAAISKRLCRSEKAIWHRARKIGIELPQLRKKSGLLRRLGACPNSRCSILSESDSTVGYEQVFSPLEYRSDAASAAKCAGLMSPGLS